LVARTEFAATNAKRMQRIMATHDRRVLDVALEPLIDDRFVRAVDKTGAIGSIYGCYGINTDSGLR
jgi:hypothetical protein